MIHEVDESLRLLMRQEALQGADIEILFEAPTKEWAGRRNTPTIDIYLYDIREDLSRREEGIREVRDERGRVVSRGKPPRFYKLSYLVTAWTQRPEDEHRLLSACLSMFLLHPELPAEVLTGSIKESGLSVMCNIALPPPQDRSISDIWSALGGELKPSLDLTIVAPMDTGRSLFVGPPLIEAPIIGFRAADDATANRARPAIPGVPRQPTSSTAAEPEPEGKGKRRRAAAKDAPPERPDRTTMPEAWDEVDEHVIAEPLPEESVMPGEGGVGRVFRMQGMPRKKD